MCTASDIFSASRVITIAADKIAGHPQESALRSIADALREEANKTRVKPAPLPLPENGVEPDTVPGPRVLLFSNVAGRKLTIRPDDILVFLNRAVPAALYREDAAERKILFRRSAESSYGQDLPFCENRLVFDGDRAIPAAFIDNLRAGYDWNYPIEKDKERSMTTGYMVANYLRYLYPERPLVLVNFGFAVRKSTYRCPWHNWRFEDRALENFVHVYG